MGQLTITKQNLQYKKYNYTYGEKTYSGIHVFTTKKNTQSIAPAISATKVALSNLNPAPISADKVIAKTNGNMYEYDINTFFGFFYQGSQHPMYVEGKAYWTSTLPTNSVMFTNVSPKYWPSFCVKNDGTATIRWFKDKSTLLAALPYCKCVIASVHALVFDGKCVFNEPVYDSESPSKLIMHPGKSTQGSDVRFNPNNGAPNSGNYRTLLGHKAGKEGIYMMVSTDAKITCQVAANLMLDLGCDYAVNMDGGSPVQMRIKNGYGASGQVNSNQSLKIHTAICAHEI